MLRFARRSRLSTTGRPLMLLLFSFLLPAPAGAQLASFPNVAPNPGFEAAVAGAPVPWVGLGDGFVRETSAPRSGIAAIRCTNSAAGQTRGAVLSMSLPPSPPGRVGSTGVPLLITAAARATDVSGTPDGQFALVAEATLAGGAILTETVAFATGTHDWEERQVLLLPAKPVTSLKVTLRFAGHTGSAWFDDLSVQSLDLQSRLPASLARPRLYLNTTPLAEFRRRVSDPAYQPYWPRLLARARLYAGQQPHPIEYDEEPVAYLALAYLGTGDTTLRDAAFTWMRALAAESNWWNTRQDWVVGALLTWIAPAYDWLYPEMPPDLRKTLRAQLIDSGRRMFGVVKNLWGSEYLWSHAQRDLAGLIPTIVALWGDEGVPMGELEQWLAYGLAFYRESARALPAEGSSHEGVGYAQVMLVSRLQIMAALDPLLGGEIGDSPWLRNITEFRVFATRPGETGVADFGDCPRGPAPWDFPVGLFHRVAALYDDSRAQWLAGRLQTVLTARAEAPEHWRDMFWYDPSVPSVGPGSLPTGRLFPDLGLVTMRGGWTADALYVAIKSGAAMGEAAQARYGASMPMGIQHAHPDSGSLILHAFGQPLLVDDEYTLLKKSSTHNVVLVDGKEQAGSGQRWFDGPAYFANGGKGKVLKAEHGATLSYVVTEQGAVYPTSLNLKSWRRHVVTCWPRVVLVVDQLQAGASRSFEQLWQTEAAVITQSSREFRFQINGVGLQLFDATPGTLDRGVRVQQGIPDVLPTRRVIFLRGSGTSRTFVTLLAPWRPGRDSLVTAITATLTGTKLTVTWKEGTLARRVDLDLTALKATLGGSSVPSGGKGGTFSPGGSAL